MCVCVCVWVCDSEEESERECEWVRVCVRDREYVKESVLESEWVCVSERERERERVCERDFLQGAFYISTCSLLAKLPFPFLPSVRSSGNKTIIMKNIFDAAKTFELSFVKLQKLTKINAFYQILLNKET